VSDVTPYFKEPRKKRSRGRARPDEPLAFVCEAFTDACTGRAEHRHHVLPRSAGGGDTDTIDVCLACPVHIHGNPSEAYERGWLRRRGA
jgi:hypothetical protein